MKTTLILVRHGETAWHAKNQYYGHTDVPLSPKGYKQGLDVARALSGAQVDAVYTSDLTRSKEVGDLVAKEHELEVVVNPALREMNFGEWEGKTHDELLVGDAGRYGSWLDAPGMIATPEGETLPILAARVKDAITTIVRENKGKQIVLVAHGGPIKTTLMDALGIPFSHFMRLEIKYGSFSVLDFFGETPLLVTINDTHHLA